MTDLRKAAEMALEAFKNTNYNADYSHYVINGVDGAELITALTQALAQPEQEPVAWMEDSIEFYAKDHPTNSCTIPLYTAPPSNLEKEKESTAQTVDPRLLLGRSNNFTKETGNRLCDIERRLAAIETQTAPPSKPLIALTDEEIADVWANSKRDVFDFVIPFARAIEAKLGSKNNG